MFGVLYTIFILIGIATLLLVPFRLLAIPVIACGVAAYVGSGIGIAHGGDAMVGTTFLLIVAFAIFGLMTVISGALRSNSFEDYMEREAPVVLVLLALVGFLIEIGRRDDNKDGDAPDPPRGTPTAKTTSATMFDPKKDVPQQKRSTKPVAHARPPRSDHASPYNQPSESNGWAEVFGGAILFVIVIGIVVGVVYILDYRM